MQDFYPVILGSDENAYGSARLFVEEYGVKPLLLCERRLIPTYYSRLFDVECIENFGSEEIFYPALEARLDRLAKTYSAIVVVPCSDYYAALMARAPRSILEKVKNGFPSAELLARLDTKDKFYELCESFGMDYPATLVLEKDERTELSAKMKFDFPVIVKPENSNAYDYLHASFEGKKKVYYIENAEEYALLAAKLNASSWNGKLIIQEFIPGSDEAMRTVNAYSGLDGRVRAISLGQPVLEEYAPKTLGNYAAIISRCDRDITNKIAAFLNDIGYVGFSNFDMKYDSRTGKYMLFEINPRLGRSSYYVRGAGINMMRVMIDDAVYGRSTELETASETVLWHNVPRDVVKRYVKDTELAREIKSLISAGRELETIRCAEDVNLFRMLWIWRYYRGQRKNYKRYFFDKKH